MHFEALILYYLKSSISYNVQKNEFCAVVKADEILMRPSETHHEVIEKHQEKFEAVETRSWIYISFLVPVQGHTVNKLGYQNYA